MKLKPSEIRYSQDSISNEFSDINHGTIIDAFKKLLDGTLEVHVLGRVEVGHYLGNWVAFEGNRRLFIFKNLEKAGKITYIEVKVIRPSQYHITRKYTTEDGGLTIRVRRYKLIQRDIDHIIAQYKNKHKNTTVRAANINQRNQYSHANLAVTAASRPNYDYLSNTSNTARSVSSSTSHARPNVRSASNSRPVSASHARPNVASIPVRQQTYNYDTQTTHSQPSNDFTANAYPSYLRQLPANQPVTPNRAPATTRSFSTRPVNPSRDIHQVDISFRDDDDDEDVLAEPENEPKKCCCIIS